MSALLWKALGGIVLAGALVVAMQVYRIQRNEARADAVAAHAQQQQAQAAFEGERIAVGAAVSANVQNDKLLREEGQRCGAALGDADTALKSCRAMVKKCTSDEAVADRLGQLFPATSHP
jgi:hypothetical protein